ncbi:MAG: CopG family transcriptional regulator [Bryobacterales bacterium]|nr:CopG family transcriptional regulator [Bryobacterales bacterium]
MRTTLDLDEDVLALAKQLAAQKGQSAGKVISELVRQALEPRKASRTRNGVPLIEPLPGAVRAHLALVNRLRDAE